MQQINIKHYTAEEYQFSEEPYEFLLSLSDFQRSACLNIMADNEMCIRDRSKILGCGIDFMLKE